MIALLVSAAHICTAQYNDSTHYYTGLASNGTINNTSASSAYVLTNTLKLGVRKKSISLNSTNTWLYGQQNARLTNNDYSSVLDFNLYRSLPHFYYWGLADYTTSYSLQINNQYQGGLGIAYNFIDKKDAYLNVSDGFIYESSNITLKDNTRQQYSTCRNSFRISFRWVIQNIFTINGMGFYQPSLEYQTDYIVKATAGAGVKLGKWFTIGTSFAYNRFNRTKKENTLFTYGITIDKYF